MNFAPIQQGCWENLILFFFGYWATKLDGDSTVSIQAKIQMLKTSCWIFTILLKSLLKSLPLKADSFFPDSLKYFLQFFLLCLFFILVSQSFYFLQRYTYRVLQTIQLKLMLFCVWAEPAVLGSTKTALKFKYET